MALRWLMAAAGVAALVGVNYPARADTLPFPPYDQLGKYRAAGEDPTYHVNEYGYGNPVRGPNGSIGGYPAGSAGAQELEIQHEQKCRYAPESC